MLGIHRNDLPTTLSRRLLHKVSGHHQRFLVGERHPLARFQGGDRRLQSRRPHDGIDHDVHIRMGGRLDKAERTRLTVARGAVGSGPLAVSVHQSNEPGPRVLPDFLQLISRTERRDRDHAEPVRVTPHYTERARAD